MDELIFLPEDDTQYNASALPLQTTTWLPYAIPNILTVLNLFRFTSHVCGSSYHAFGCVITYTLQILIHSQI